jgi:hypothetical protein
MQEIEIKSDENDCYISKEEIITTEDKEIQGELIGRYSIDNFKPQDQLFLTLIKLRCV